MSEVDVIDGLAAEAVMVYLLSGDYSTVNNLPPFPHRLFCTANNSTAYITHAQKVVYVKHSVVAARLLPLQLISFKPGLDISTFCRSLSTDKP